ncbi:hypothetical protein C2W62_29495 [Candidatus Entotheonella serta]|nr:hypothetical protein C2W62_29495 [Candidatus Entotheonella serta]
MSILSNTVRSQIRANYLEEMAIVADYQVPFRYFFGMDYDQETVRNFEPDVLVDSRTEVTIGGTRFDLIPVPGGETVDGMFISIPDNGVLFVGDFIMPYLGVPFVSEGSVLGLLEAIDVVAALNPKHLLHGHRPLTDLFNAPELLTTLKTHLEWLHGQTMQAIYRGVDRVTTQQQNLMPPFIHQHPEVHLHYLVLRENVINRLCDQHTGYWQTNLDGMDTLSHQEFGVFLTYYLNLSEGRLVKVVNEMVRSGDYELAGRILAWSLTQFPDSRPLAALQHTAF